MKIKPKLKNLDRIATQIQRKHTERSRHDMTRLKRGLKALWGRGDAANVSTFVSGGDR